jgi:hypothetical protein
MSPLFLRLAPILNSDLFIIRQGARKVTAEAYAEADGAVFIFS